MKLIVYYPVKSANQFVYSSWRAYFGYKKTVHKHLDGVLLEFFSDNKKNRSSFFGNKFINIESVRNRYLDYDNLVAGCKPFLDWLKKAGLIYDDNPNEVTISVKQTIVKKLDKEYTIITLKK